jgi:ribose 5-phosphate isomerase B
MKIAIGNDHAAVEMKNEIKAYLESKGHEVINFGTDTSDSCDYPVYGQKVAEAVASGQAEEGVLICGTGIGISLAANKVPGIRAAVCSEPVSARLAKQHNDANIIAFGARIVGLEEAKAIVVAFFDAEFEGGRHQRRIDLITAVEEKYNK